MIYNTQSLWVDLYLRIYRNFPKYSWAAILEYTVLNLYTFNSTDLTCTCILLLVHNCDSSVTCIVQ